MREPTDIGALERAVDDRLRDGDVDGAVAAISDSWPDVSASAGARLRSLIDRLPETHWNGDPWLMAAMGASYRSLDSPSRSAALPWFGTAEQLIAADPTPDAEIAMIRVNSAAAFRSLGRLTRADAAARSADELLERDLSLPASGRVRAQAQAALQLGLIQLHRGMFSDASSSLRLALGLSDRALTIPELVECLSGLALLKFLVGDFRAAARFTSSARDTANGSGLSTSRFGAASLVAETMVAIEQNRIDDARALASQLAMAAYRSDWEPFAEFAAGSLALVGGRHIEGLDHVRRCLDGLSSWEGNPIVTRMAETLRGVLLIHLGEFASATTVLDSIEPTLDHSICPARFIAGIRYKAGDSAGCLAALTECEALGETHSARTVIDVLLLRAAASYDLDNAASADVALDRALHLAASNDSRISFVLVSAVSMQRMLERAADRSQPLSVHELLDEMRVAHGTAITGSLEPLSERELDVAQHLFEDKTVSQIASDLYISSNTVKTHVRSIYRKLSANNRRDAIRRVKELGLHLDITPH